MVSVIRDENSAHSIYRNRGTPQRVQKLPITTVTRAKFEKEFRRRNPSQGFGSQSLRAQNHKSKPTTSEHDMHLGHP